LRLSLRSRRLRQALASSAANQFSIAVLPDQRKDSVPAFPVNSPADRAPSIQPALFLAALLPADLALPVSGLALLRDRASALVPALADLVPEDRADRRHLHQKQAVRSALLRVAAAVVSSNIPRRRKAR
jgi:hypothetical protein